MFEEIFILCSYFDPNSSPTVAITFYSWSLGHFFLDIEHLRVSQNTALETSDLEFVTACGNNAHSDKENLLFANDGTNSCIFLALEAKSIKENNGFVLSEVCFISPQ